MQLRPTRAPAWFTRTLSLRRNARLKPKSTTRTATGINAARVVQKSMGMTGGSFNTREFFHGASAPAVRMARVGFQGCPPGRCCPARRWLGCWRWPRRRPACWPSAGSSSPRRAIRRTSTTRACRDLLPFGRWLPHWQRKDVLQADLLAARQITATLSLCMHAAAVLQQHKIPVDLRCRVSGPLAACDSQRPRNPALATVPVLPKQAGRRRNSRRGRASSGLWAAADLNGRSAEALLRTIGCNAGIHLLDVVRQPIEQFHG